MILSLQERIGCGASFATDNSPHLQCEYGGNCDGNLYDCCCWENEDKEYEWVGRLYREHGEDEKV